MKIYSPEIERIARTCHEVNRAYCAAIGDRSQMPWADAEDWQKDSACAGVQFSYDNPDATPADQHAAWSAVKVAQGWTYGEVKDAGAKTHPCLVSYDQLPLAQRIKDNLFQSVVKTLSTEAPAPRYRIVSDDDGHSYVIPAQLDEAFHGIVEAIGKYWSPDNDFDHSGDAPEMPDWAIQLDGSPSSVTSADYRVDP